jgi:hypothetical protein
MLLLINRNFFEIILVLVKFTLNRKNYGQSWSKVKLTLFCSHLRFRHIPIWPLPSRHFRAILQDIILRLHSQAFGTHFFHLIFSFNCSAELPRLAFLLFQNELCVVLLAKWHAQQLALYNRALARMPTLFLTFVVAFRWK